MYIIILVAGLIEFAVSILTLWFINKGSKSQFAYHLVLFTVGSSVFNISEYFENQRRIDTNYGPMPLISWYTINIWLYLILGLQGWLFAIRYLQSASAASFCSESFQHKINGIGIIVAILYTVGITVTSALIYLSFPGYNNQLPEW